MPAVERSLRAIRAQTDPPCCTSLLGQRGGDGILISTEAGICHGEKAHSLPATQTLRAHRFHEGPDIGVKGVMQHAVCG